MSSPRDVLRGASPGSALEARCGVCGKVVLTTATREDAVTYTAMHLTLVHNHQGAVILEGQDFTLEPAPHRCDLCWDAVEPPWWHYETPPAPPDFQVEDAGWLVCDICHGIIQSQPKPLAALVERTLAIQTAGIALDRVGPVELRRHVKGLIRRFLDHRQGEPVRQEIA